MSKNKSLRYEGRINSVTVIMGNDYLLVLGEEFGNASEGIPGALKMVQ